MKAVFALAIVGILGGVAPLFMKVALNEFNSFQIIFIRFGIACILILPLLIGSVKKSNCKKLLQVLPASILFSGNIFFMVIGIQYTTSIVSQLFYLLTPVFVSLIGYSFFREKISTRRILSMGVCFFGSTFLILRSIGSSDLISSIGTSKGNLIILCAVTCWSLYVIYTKRISTRVEPSFFLVVNFLTAFIIGGMALILTHTSLLETLIKFTTSSAPTMASLITLGVINSVLFFFLYQWSLKYVSAFIVASTTYLSPLSAAVFAIPFFGEKLSITLIISAASIFLGSYLILSEKK
jgi:drug/metabolite transporter (DMT)-like permease